MSSERTPRKIPELKPLFVERMKQLLPDKKDFQNYIDILKVQPVRSIRCNELKISPEELKKRLEKKSWIITQPWKDYPEVMIVEGKSVKENCKAHLFVEKNEKIINQKTSKKLSINNSLAPKALMGGGAGKNKSPLQDLEPGELGRALEHILGYYYIQELASMLPPLILNPKPNELILDLCASPGSKTTQMASMMNNTGTIIANEVSFGRIKILANNLERCGVSSAIITKKEGAALCKKLDKLNYKFDKILLDAPCSGEGTLRSSPKTYSMWNPNTIIQLSKIQKQLISACIQILKKDGEIVYSTCTHAPEENEEILDYIIKEFPNQLEIQKIKLPIKSQAGITKWNDKEYLEDVKHSCRVYPHVADTEGFFLAKIKKIK